ncbi:MAG: chemotaxis response regulator protein-glutamate methylesterase [Treponema sp. GWB1_62_6]|nr:MAG: chemotaxis response regulator protein-glutamate methylesterase [Treponema sp. GWB1_62_6]OHE70029.1 MAG: chemotaxis response regulator protein-glutamate methylesterase [Treponema sp. GWC1_61_84]
MTPRIKVLIVDDSAVARDLLERALSRDPDIEVVGKASDAFAARDKIVFLKPDVITLDVEMPRMDGIEFLKRLMAQFPIPTVVVSAVTAEGSRKALDALDAGAIEVVGKPSAMNPNALSDMIAELVEKVKAAAGADLSKIKAVAAANAVTKVRPRSKLPAAAAAASAARRAAAGAGARSRRLIAIGASTGGTTAIRRIVEAFPADTPPVVIVQHMPPVFTGMFAEALDKSSAMTVREAEDGMPLVHGLVLVAPGDRHLRIAADGDGWVARCSDGPKVSGHRPSVDVLFNSVAAVAGSDAVAALLTGMGRDGADGMLAILNAGGRCIAQDEASSVVWGMPREAWSAGAAEKLVPLDSIARELLMRLAKS